MSDSIEPERSNPLAGRNISFLPCKSSYMSADPQPDSPGSGCANGIQGTTIERLITLKQELRVLDSDTFWARLMENITSICNSQYGFVARRVRDDEPVMELGGLRPCVFGSAFYYNDGYQTVGMHRDRYFAGGNPLSHMDHEKPCLIPENLGSVISFGSDKLPFAAEGYLAVPLFLESRCVAYLGLMWSESGLRKRTLSWSILEMILYSLEDLVVQRIRADAKRARKEQKARELKAAQKTVDDAHAILHGFTEFSTQPFQPYARSLSHELRTPMQGVVGMLDVMHATVREAMEGKASAKNGTVFQSLKESIEMVQDSARRAVEAADNVVHAYDLNMQVPKTPQVERENDLFSGPAAQSPVSTFEGRPNIFIEGSNITVNPYKRRRSNAPEWPAGPAPKPKAVRVSPPKDLSPRSEEVKNAVHESEKIIHATPACQIEAVMANMVDPPPSLAARRSAPHLLLEGININLKGPALRFTKLRDLLRLVINESLHVGGRPDFAVGDATELGEKIEVRSRSSNGQVNSKTINWTVDPALPETLLVDDRDLAKLISCVFLNAVKFTNTGTITVAATVGRKANDVLITVRDTGPGIPAAFLPRLFKPFAREDASTTRSKDGLGLGLLVAKGLARKMGGDLICVRSSTSGPDHGSEFEIRLPFTQPDARPATPRERTITPPIVDASRLSSSSSIHESSIASSSSPSARLHSRPFQQPSPSLSEDIPSQASTPARSLPGSSKAGRTSINGDSYDSKLGEKHPLTFLVAEDNRINRRVLVNMLKKLGYHDVYEACNGKEAVRTMEEIVASYRTAHTPGGLFQTPDCGNEPEDIPIPDKRKQHKKPKPVDIVLMDLWMPEMDGYEATSRILQLIDQYHGQIPPNSSSSGLPTASQHPLFVTSNPTRVTTNGISSSLFPLPTPTVLAVSADVSDEALGRASKVGMKGYMTKPYKLTDLERLIIGFCDDPTPTGLATADPMIIS